MSLPFVSNLLFWDNENVELFLLFVVVFICLAPDMTSSRSL